MTDINELVQRKNAAISQLTTTFEPGHISPREVDALSLAVDVMNELVEALEKAQKRVSELESRTVTVKLPAPACTYADHSYPAYSRAQVVELLEKAGIKWEEK